MTWAGDHQGVSDSPESDSDCGFGRLSGYRPGTSAEAQPAIGSDAWMDRLVGKLRPVMVAIAAEHLSAQPPVEIVALEHDTLVPPPQVEPVAPPLLASSSFAPCPPAYPDSLEVLRLRRI